MGTNSLEIMALHAPFLWTLKDLVKNSLDLGRGNIDAITAGLLMFIITLISTYFLSLGYREFKKLLK